MKKKKETKRKPSLGEVIGSGLRALVEFFVFFCKVVYKVLSFTGLWIPLLYALFGLILYWSLGFDPIRLDVWGTLYLCGMIACVLACAVILIKNVVVRPVKSVIRGYKNPVWRRGRDVKSETVASYKTDKRYSPPELSDFRPERDSTVEYLAPVVDFAEKNDLETRRAQYSLYPDWLPKIQDEAPQSRPVMVSSDGKETPKTYYSKLDPKVLVYEYEDRFELYRESGGQRIQIGVEFK